jgi:hypothetical protein
MDEALYGCPTGCRELDALRSELEAAREQRVREQGAAARLLQEQLEAEQAAHQACRVPQTLLKTASSRACRIA